MNRKLNKLSTLVYSLMVAFMLLATVFTTPLSIFAQETEVSSVVTETIPTAPVEESEVTAETTVAPEEEISTEPVVESESTDSDFTSESTEEKPEDEMASSANVNGPAKELPNVIKTLKFYDSANKLMGGDPIRHIHNADYGMELNFDLTPYDNNLNNGDHFTFTVPAPMTLIGKTVELDDADTKVNIATAVVESAGPSQGGTIKITLKNLEEYLRIKGGNNVVAVKGFVKVNYKYENLGDVTLPITDATSEQSYNHKVEARTATVIGAEGEHLYKGGGVMVEEAWQSDILGKGGVAYHPWALYINRPKIDAGTLVIHDTMSLQGSPWQFIPESVKLLRVEYIEGSRMYKTLETLDHSGMVAFANNYTDMTLTIPNAGTNQYLLTYRTTAPGDGTFIWNEATITNDGQALSIHKNGTTLEKKSAFSKLSQGIALDVTFRVVLFKVDQDDPSLRLPGAKFLITSDAGYSKEFISDDNGMVYADKDQLVAGNYTVTELQAPPGYIKTMEPIKVKVDRNGVVKTITNKREEITFTATKKWVNAPAARPEVSLQLMRDGVAYGAPKTIAANSADGATAVWTNLPKFQRGTTIPSVYTVVEAAVDNYTAEYKDLTATGVTVENTNTEKVEVTVTKVWEDKNNKLQTRPANITLRLLDGTNEVQTAEVTGDATAAQWTHAFTNLPKYKADGTEYVYTVDEVLPADSKYTKSIQGTTITNTVNFDEKITVSGKKVWDDNNNVFQKRPDSITVNLLQNNTKLKSETVTGATNEWTFQFTELPKYDANGDVYSYTVTEEFATKNPVDATDVYTTEITGDAATGFTITNTYVNREKVSVSGKKIWEDANNQDGKRPSSITVVLHVNGSKHSASTRELSEANGWSYSFENLPKYTTDAQEILYTVKEEEVPAEYSVEYARTAEGNNIINKYTPGKTSVTVTKVWEDANNQDGKRPTEVKVQLLADGMAQDELVTLDATNNWMYTWTDLAQKKAGVDVVYTVEEVAVEGYTTEITGDARQGFTITNTHAPAVVTVSGSKVWDDANNQQGLRPASIKVNVLADGQVVATKEVTEADGWAFEVTNLPEFAAGKKILYTVMEESVSDYTVNITGQATSGVTITNTYAPQMTNLMVVKQWNDANDVDKLRPTSVEVELLVNNQPTGKKAELNEANNWTHNFADLDKVLNGEAQTYSVKEVSVPEGYTSEVRVVDEKNVIITNSHTPKPAPKQEKSIQKALPKTGESVTIWTTILGVILLVIVASYVYYTKKYQG